MAYRNKINTNVLDKIILSDKDVNVMDNAIKKYLDNNLSLALKVSDVEAPIKSKGIIEFTSNLNNALQSSERDMLIKMGVNPNSVVTTYFFELQDSKIKVGEMNVTSNTLELLLTFDYEMNLVSSAFYNSNYKKNQKEHGEKLVDVSKMIIMCVVTFYKYSQLMKFLNEENAILKRQALIKASKPKGKTKKEREREERRKRISVSKPKVNYDYEDSKHEGETRSYERQAESWEVTGHWRHYKKSDKRVYIKGYKKGQGNRQGKDFTL